jgi:hypothetical protein
MDSQYFVDENGHVNNYSVFGNSMEDCVADNSSINGYKEENESIFKLYIH